ncbi:MAG: acetyl-CoA carboxylase biotin carboxyl carrier protein subunit, partial [Candidatus Zixiibacteriota bacterium]
TKRSGRYEITIGGSVYDADCDGAVVRLRGKHAKRDGARDDETVGRFAATRERVYVDLDGTLMEFDIPSVDYDGHDHTHAGERDKLYAPMPGKIVKIITEIGDRVAAKQPLAIVESMKMENQLLSPSEGTVKRINCRPGDQVDTDTPLIELAVDD